MHCKVAFGPFVDYGHVVDAAIYQLTLKLG